MFGILYYLLILIIGVVFSSLPNTTLQCIYFSHSHHFQQDKVCFKKGIVLLLLHGILIDQSVHACGM